MCDPSETSDSPSKTNRNGTSVLPQTTDDLNQNLRPRPAHEADIRSPGNLKAPRETGPHRHHHGQHQEEVRVVPIHQRPDLLLPCADLVNEEWRRSQGARVHSLQKSCQEFPVSLVLLTGSPGAERLLGHARLSRVVGHGASLFVESVVVPEAERGKGYGRTLMELTERYARGRGFSRLCLTTHDKQRFYGHLGYTPSGPVQSAGALASIVPLETLLQHLQPSPSPVSPGTPPPEALSPALPPPVPPVHSLPPPNSIPPPPPPPPPQVALFRSLPPPPPPPTSIPPPALPPSLISPLPCLSSPPPPPTSILAPPPLLPPPPPPPPPFAPPSSPLHAVPPPPSPLSFPPSVERGGHMTTIDTPYRDARGTPIFWMHKDI